ncbi:phage holin family protein [Laspinema sp. A4]|uniref:phage holin family protein n=1 Tax=Laspinema sp. D2d TaxID=2953686 RepID=UPI0021BA9022|nr:phage holin family protein [Laspinema sp. D2d]MCT7985831.1 phage holin family protein [Laspinema sp. D2d]
MIGFIITWFVAAISLLITSYVVPGIDVAGFSSAALAAILMGLINAIVKPILVLLTLPLTILTLGLFLLVINGITLSLVGYLTPGFDVNGFLPAIIGAIVLSLVSSAIGHLVKEGTNA